MMEKEMGGVCVRVCVGGYSKIGVWKPKTIIAVYNAYFGAKLISG